MSEKANLTTVSKLFDKTLFSLWPNGIKHDNSILLVTDAAPYDYIVYGISCKIHSSLLYKTVHVTCIAHDLYRVCEQIRAEFPCQWTISNTKKVFLKAPTRVELFRREAPDMPLPPPPIITRWGLKSTIYDCENLKTIKKCVNLLNADDAL